MPRPSAMCGDKVTQGMRESSSTVAQNQTSLPSHTATNQSKYVTVSRVHVLCTHPPMSEQPPIPKPSWQFKHTHILQNSNWEPLAKQVGVEPRLEPTLWQA